MKHYTEFNFELSNYSVVQSKGIKYYNLECALDTETTSLNITEKTGLCYIWMIGFGDSDDHIYYGRYLDELVTFLTSLSTKWDLNENKIVRIYVHNLAFDFQFIKNYFNWIDIFATALRQPIRAVCDLGFEFSDSLILSGYSLKSVGDHLHYHKLEKAVGELDYSLIRTPETKLSDLELHYCHMDIRVVLAYINEEIKLNGTLARIPMTNTGRVRKAVRDECFYYSYNIYNNNKEFLYKKAKLLKYFREKIQSLYLDKKQYQLAKEVYQGGFTHANLYYVDKTVEVGKNGVLEIISKDFTSSYPTVLLSEKYPMSSPIKVEVTDYRYYIDHVDELALMTRVKLWNISNKTVDTPLSESKCRVLENEVLNNGRVLSADYVETAINELDLLTILECYDIGRIEFFDSYEMRKAYLPINFIRCIINYYNDKTTLKNVEGKEAEYQLSKGMLNAIYGMCVMDLYKPSIEYSEEFGWYVDEHEDMEEVLNKTQKKSSRFNYYLWGIWCSAYARRNLWTGILEADDDFLYSDTDSIKIIINKENKERMNDYFKRYNENITNKLKAMCEFYNLDYSRLEPYTVDGIKKPLGVWDDDGNYKLFKTLGAKRYLTFDGSKIKLTCAGVSKNNGIRYMCKQCGVSIDAKCNVLSGDVQKVFDYFNFKLVVPATETGKNTHLYNDKEMILEVTDYLGNKGNFETKGGVYIEQAPFKLNANDMWLTMIEEMVNNREILIGEFKEGF